MRVRLKPQSLAVIIAVIMFGGIAASNALNYWETESTKVPAQYTSGEYKGSYNPADIRGSYSFGDVSESFGIPVEHLAKAFNLAEDDNAAEFLCKELETMYEKEAAQGMEIGTDSVRVFVALYKGLPIDFADTFMPAGAYQVLIDYAELTQEGMEYMNTHTIGLNNDKPQQGEKIQADANTSSPEDNEEQNKEDRQLKGKTTFKELLDWGVAKEEIEQAIGREMPNATISIRDFCVQQGIEFSPIKAELQDIIDKK